MKKLFKKQKGITLIALVVTIIVLIILAGVSINLVIGEDGIITKAKEASVKQTHAQVISAVEMQYVEYETELASESLDDNSFINYLGSNNFIRDDESIDIVALIGNGATLGKGTDFKDEYFVSDWSGADNEVYYDLWYLDKDSEEELLWSTENSNPTDDPTDEPEDDNVSDSYFIANKQGTIIGLTDEGKKQTALVVPTTISGVNITAISTTWTFGTGAYILTSLTIPNTITSITMDSLSGCESLSNLTFLGTMEEWSKFGFTQKFPYSMSLKVIHCTDGDVTL